MHEFLVYRQDTHGQRFLVASGLSENDASDLLRQLEAGQEHHQDYFSLRYEHGQLIETLRKRAINL